MNRVPFAVGGMSEKRLYAAVGACAAVVHLGALWNGFAMDDVFIVRLNPLVQSPQGIWRAFLAPYWPADFGGAMYRPLTIATFAVDGLVAAPWWFHLVNVLWHAGATVAVAALALRWAGGGGGGGATAGLVAGLLFAVHPVHVEAVAYLVGRAELMGTLFTLLAVYAAVERDSVGWSAAALAAGLLSKENAAVAPALIAWAWLLSARRPSRSRILRYAGTWVLLAGAYALVRVAVLGPYSRYSEVAPVFLDASPVGVRLTAVAALADVARLLVFPLHLRADYSPDERTLITTPLDWRFALGVACVAVWAMLLLVAWRRGRRSEATGLGWIALALLPVTNLLFPSGVLLAERTLYLPSAGLVLAAAAWLKDLPPRRLWAIVGVAVLAGGVRSAWRVSVWRDNRSLAFSILEDSPRSSVGPWAVGAVLQRSRQPERALAAFLAAAAIERRNARLYVAAADAAYTLGRPALADSLLMRAEAVCSRCLGNYRVQAAAARARRDSATADSLLARAARLAAP